MGCMGREVVVPVSGQGTQDCGMRLARDISQTRWSGTACTRRFAKINSTLLAARTLLALAAAGSDNVGVSMPGYSSPSMHRCARYLQIPCVIANAWHSLKLLVEAEPQGPELRNVKIEPREGGGLQQHFGERRARRNPPAHTKRFCAPMATISPSISAKPVVKDDAKVAQFTKFRCE